MMVVIFFFSLYSEMDSSDEYMDSSADENSDDSFSDIREYFTDAYFNCLSRLEKVSLRSQKERYVSFCTACKYA